MWSITNFALGIVAYLPAGEAGSLFALRKKIEAYLPAGEAGSPVRRETPKKSLKIRQNTQKLTILA